MRKFYLMLLVLIISINSFGQTSTGCQSGDCDNGYGLYYFSNGDKYVGYWSGSTMNGWGTYKFKDKMVYVGEMKNGTYDGWGMFTWGDGTIYVGSWKDGKQNGLGTFIDKNLTQTTSWYANGSATSTYSTKSGADECVYGNCQDGYGVYRYSGDKPDFTAGRFVGGKKNGKFFYLHGTGGFYCGDWGNIGNDKTSRQGLGTFVWESGEVYAGEWTGGLQGGNAVDFLSSGSINIGRFEGGSFKESGTVVPGGGNVVNNVVQDNNVTKEACITGNCTDGYGTYVWKSGEKYEGYWVKDKRNGQGTNKYSSGNVYVGNWKDDQHDGYGTLKYANGDKYIGYWEVHKKKGQGTYIFANGNKYVGEWADNKYNGKGTLYKSDGTTQSGNWKDGDFVGEITNVVNNNSVGCVSGNCTDGYGVYVFESGEKYDGYWARDKRNGQGTNYYKDGDKYTGEWKDDKCHGYGTYNYKNGDSYVGNYVEMKRNGFGTFIFKDRGDKYVGQWKDNMYNGEGTLYKADGTKQSGIWKDDAYQGQSQDNYGCISGNCTNGTGTYIFQSGDKYIGSFRNSEYSGQGTFFFASGDKYVGEWSNNTYNGQGSYTFSADNRKYVGAWKDGKQNGYGSMYYSNGTVETGTWKDGTFVGSSNVNNNVSGSKPQITWINPEYFTTSSSSSSYTIKLCIASKSPLKNVQVYINGSLSIDNANRGFQVDSSACDFSIERAISLSNGDNKIKIVVTNDNGTTESDERTITYSSSKTEKRLALVIGNSEYKENPLRNPVNDASAIAGTLRELGFEVMLSTNASNNDMKKLMRSFGEKLAANGGTGLFYYAGHGIQMNGENYLVPVDAQITKEQDVEMEGVNLKRILGEMDYARNDINIVILDACRNNPFVKSFRSAGNNGLSTTTAPQGTFIAYATAPGSVAADGTGNNGLYTEELLKAMKTPKIKIEEVFKMVRTNVYQRSNKQQVPWDNSSIFGDFYFQK